MEGAGDGWREGWCRRRPREFAGISRSIWCLEIYYSIWLVTPDIDEPTVTIRIMLKLMMSNYVWSSNALAQKVFQ